MNYNDKYLPIDPDFLEIIIESIKERKSGKTHYFDSGNKIELAEGKLDELIQLNSGRYLKIEGTLVRLDKIITLLGRPGPSYDAYDRYANVCLTCEDLGQFGK